MNKYEDHSLAFIKNSIETKNELILQLQIQEVTEDIDLSKEIAAEEAELDLLLDALEKKEQNSTSIPNETANQSSKCATNDINKNSSTDSEWSSNDSRVNDTSSYKNDLKNFQTVNKKCRYGNKCSKFNTKTCLYRHPNAVTHVVKANGHNDDKKHISYNYTAGTGDTVAHVTYDYGECHENKSTCYTYQDFQTHNSTVRPGSKSSTNPTKNTMKHSKKTTIQNLKNQIRNLRAQNRRLKNERKVLKEKYDSILIPSKVTSRQPRTSHQKMASRKRKLSQRQLTSHKQMMSQQSMMSQQPMLSQQRMTSQQPMTSPQPMTSQQPMASQQKMASRKQKPPQRKKTSHLHMTQQKQSVQQTKTSSKQMTSQRKMLTYQNMILIEEGSPHKPKLISTGLSSGGEDQSGVTQDNAPVQSLVTNNWVVERNSAHGKSGKAYKVTRVDKATQHANGAANLDDFNGSTHTQETDDSKHTECSDSGCGETNSEDDEFQNYFIYSYYPYLYTTYQTSPKSS